VSRVTVAFLWHMHQPLYLDHFEKSYLLPWVRLHGLKDYYGMVALLREFPLVKMTYNLVPSLLQQLLDYERGTASERFQTLSLKPAAELTDEDRVYVLRNFFMACRPTMVARFPRYEALLEKRGPSVEDGDLRRAARILAVQDFLDLQVLQKMAWVDEEYLQKDERLLHLIKRGKNYVEADKATLAEVEREILGKIVPEYQAAAARGQVELSTTPYYHPILPLLIDSHIAREANIRTKLLSERFAHPEDAVHQLRAARQLFRKLFGWDPTGLWPSEGSVSMETLSLAAAEGFRWAATDEEILEQSLGASLARGSDGSLGNPGMLYKPYRLQVGGDSIGLLFRDHTLSDLFGFTYSKMSPKDAARDFLRRIEHIGQSWNGTSPPVVPIILDGENAWEYYDKNGREFLRRICDGMSQSSVIETATCAQLFDQVQATPIERVAPGSWIYHNFDIWIGHEEDRRAWGMLAEARDLLASKDPDHALTAAWEEIYIAEGSDWFWWYGGDHSSENDWEFDQLFRKHLLNVYSILGEPAPPELHVSIIAGRKRKGELPLVAPTRFITPKIDGRITSYFEWLGAGEYRVVSRGSSMHKTRAITQAIGFGFNLDDLYVRVDTAGRASTYFASGMEMRIVFLAPADHHVVCRMKGDAEARLFRAGQAVASCSCAADTCVESMIPFQELGVMRGERLEFYVSWQRGKEIFDAQPESSSVSLEVPDAAFESQYWEV